MKIAFFDSGIGGLSVLHHAMKVLPHEQFIFFADEDNVPYGTKTREQVFQYVSDAFSFLMTKDVKAIVVACNTATSVAVKELRHKYTIPIIGMEPAAKKALDMDTDRSRVLVIATPITVRGRKIKDLIEKYDTENLVDLLAMPGLVEFAEKMDFSSPDVEAYIRRQFAPYDFSRYSNLVLGCTHFNYFKETLRHILPDHVCFVDGNEGTIRELIRQLDYHKGLEYLPQTVEYYYSGRAVTDPQERQRINAYLQQLERVYTIE
ncbi:glutamate racemase [Megasphaera sp.]|uniref:glutamate racemase n=1 Tax=Megasphaera sp. TaxID=2023260 RepID=UPI003521DB7D